MSRLNSQNDYFSPMLFPNDAVGYDQITKPMMASHKLDGMRCIFKNGQMLSRQFKEIQNKQLNERFAKLKALSATGDMIFDGELYSHELNFQEIMHYCRTDDLGDEKLPDSLKFYCFDFLVVAHVGSMPLIHNERGAYDRYRTAKVVFETAEIPYAELLEQRDVSTPEQVKIMFDEALTLGFEGLILKAPNSEYKYGRLTTHSGMGYKFKEYKTYDSQIIDVEQATEVDPTVERKVGELGYHKTSQKKGDRILIEKASAFVVKYKETTVKVSLALTDVEKEEVWQNRDKYIGRWIEYKGMEVGAKDVPRHPVLLRMRVDKD